MGTVSRRMAITFAALSLTGSAVAEPAETVLYSFTGGSDGAGPIAGLIADNQGALYGTTQNGGTGNGGSGFGTVFKLTPTTKGQTAWTETVLYRFTGGSDGGDVYAGLIADKEGALCGTTQGLAPSYGTVFKLTPPTKGQTAWTETVLHGFTGGSDGAAPRASLIADNQGALYGTTLGGGTAGNGTVFKLTPPTKGQTAWTETVLYSFGSSSTGSDGLDPEAGLIFDKEGALYGTTSEGGTGNAGTVFKLTPPTKGQTAWTPTVLYNFCSQPSCSDGYEPRAALFFDKEGALYGTTEFGGTDNNGIVFKLIPPAKGQTVWTPTVLHSFVGGDGANPIFGGLIFDKRGALYGTTYRGGSANGGTVFKLIPPAKGLSAWTETILRSFTGSDGSNPYAGLIANQGALYGTTYSGGSAGYGTVFKLTVADP